MYRIAIIDDSNATRDIWTALLRDLNVQSFPCVGESVDAVLANMTTLPERDDLWLDGTILDMHFEKEGPGNRAGMQIWAELVNSFGCEKLGVLLVATRFSDDDIRQFARANEAIICTSVAKTHRQAALADLIRRIKMSQAQKQKSP